MESVPASLSTLEWKKAVNMYLTNGPGFFFFLSLCFFFFSPLLKIIKHAAVVIFSNKCDLCAVAVFLLLLHFCEPGGNKLGASVRNLNHFFTLAPLAAIPTFYSRHTHLTFQMIFIHMGGD